MTDHDSFNAQAQTTEKTRRSGPSPDELDGSSQNDESAATSESFGGESYGSNSTEDNQQDDDAPQDGPDTDEPAPQPPEPRERKHERQDWAEIGRVAQQFVAFVGAGAIVAALMIETVHVNPAVTQQAWTAAAALFAYATRGEISGLFGSARGKL